MRIDPEQVYHKALGELKNIRSKDMSLKKRKKKNKKLTYTHNPM